MQSSDIRSIMRRFWVAVVALALLGAVGGAYYELGRPAAYVSTIRVFTSNKVADNVPVSQTTNLAVQRMGSYVPLVSSTELAQRIINQLSLRETPLSVARSLSATFDKDTVLMTVSAKASTPQESEAIVRALPAGLTDLVSSLTKNGQVDERVAHTVHHLRWTLNVEDAVSAQDRAVHRVRPRCRNRSRRGPCLASRPSAARRVVS